MSTIPGVTVSTTVVNRNPVGTSGARVAIIGSSDQAVGVSVATPFEFTTYTQAASALGSTTTNGKMIDMIAQAFNNGAATVIGVVASATGAASDAEYQAALDVLKGYQNIDAIVVESTDLTVATKLETHVDFMATESVFRRGYVGLPSGSAVSDYVTRAEALQNDRMFVCGPNFKDSTGAEVEGGVTAAAMALIAESEADPARPISSAAVKGFNGIYLTVFNADYDTLHNGGVYTAQDRDVDSVMRYLTSVSTGTNVIKEGTISKIRDYVMTNLKSTLEREFKRRKLTTATIKEIKARTLSKFTEWQSQEIVSPDNSVTVVVEQDAVDTTKVNVNVSYYPVKPLNFIDISLTLNL